jgi:hypothetical protein
MIVPAPPVRYGCLSGGVEREEPVLKRAFAFLSRIAAATLAFGVGTAAVNAQPTQAQQEAIKSNCQTDYRTYCASVPTGGSAALQCLETNVAKLSSACQQAVNAATGSGSASSTSAPATATPPAGTTATTAAPPASTAAPAAAAAPVVVVAPGAEMALMREACGADYRAHCGGVRIIGGAAIACLATHKSSLSAACKSELTKLGQ